MSDRHGGEPLQELIHRAHLLQVLFDRLPALIAYWDRDARNVFANEAYVEWFGLTPDQTKGLHISEVLGEAVYEQNRGHIEGALAGTEQLFNRTLVDASGAVRQTQASYVPDMVDGEVAGFFVLVTDVTPRIESERDLAVAQQLAHVGSWSLDVGKGRASWSAEMARILGVQPDTAPSIEEYLRHVHPDDQATLLSRFEQGSADGLPYESDYRVIRPDGETREVRSRVRSERGPDGGVVRLNASVQDVTESNRSAREIERINTELGRANQLQADVIGMLGHDVRQPIGVILGYLEELVDGWDQTPDHVRLSHARRASTAARRMNALVDDILAMASLESGELVCRPLVLSIDAAIRSLVSESSAYAQVSVTSEVPADALVDPFHLRQVVSNLLTNALKYGEPPVEIVVVARSSHVAVEVRDAGPGVPEEFVPRLFDRFSRAESGGAARTSGTGFGLYIVRELLEANGGHISYAHNQPQGARFIATLPSLPRAR